MSARLLQRLLGPAGPEMLCDECFDSLDAYVEAELRGAEADRAAPGLRAHLDGCEACREEYEALREVAGERAHGWRRMCYLGCPK